MQNYEGIEIHSPFTIDSSDASFTGFQTSELIEIPLKVIKINPDSENAKYINYVNGSATDTDIDDAIDKIILRHPKLWEKLAK